MTLQGGTGNANNGRNLTFNVSTLGFSNIVFTFASQGTSTGFNSNQFQYSLYGVTFVDFGAPYTPSTSFALFTFDLSSIAALNNNPNATFRIVFNGATSSTGNNRLDNICFEIFTGSHRNCSGTGFDTSVRFWIDGDEWLRSETAAACPSNAAAANNGGSAVKS